MAHGFRYGGYDDNNADDIKFTRLDQVSPVVPKWSGTSQASLASATLNVQSRSWGGESILEWAGDDDYIAQADVDLNSGEDARLIVRYQNPDNYYRIQTTITPSKSVRTPVAALVPSR